MAALLCRDAYNKAAHISLGHYTHEKSPLGAAAALAALDYMEQHQVLAHVKELEAYMQQRMHALSERFAVVGQTRGCGLLWAIELVQDRQTKTKHTVLAEKVLYRCLEHGLSFKVSAGNVLSLYPPLIISKAQLVTAMDILEDAIHHVNIDL